MHSSRDKLLSIKCFLFDQMRHYNKEVQPEGDTSKGSLTVKLSINLAAIMDVVKYLVITFGDT